MSRKVYVEVKVRLILNADDDDADVGEILDEMEYCFRDTTGNADVEDTEILGYEITDSK
jgi:hypothetical protein